MAHDVFICHSAKDKTTADAVCAVIESNGVRCWIAPRDVTAGMEWSECIIDAIEECRVMVLVFTTNANESHQIRREVERAVNRGVAILPLRIEDILPGRALEYFIGNVHWLDALTPPLESHLQNLAGTVKILLARLPVHGAPIPHAAPTPPTIPAQPAILSPETTIPRAAPVAPEKSAWTEPVRPQERTDAAQVPPSQRGSAATSAVRPQKRATGIVVIAIVMFLLSSFAMVGTIHDATYGHFESDEAALLALAAAGIATSYGVITKKNWGRIFQIIVSAASVIWLLILTRDAFSESSSAIPWTCMLGFSIFVIRYMLTDRVKQEFAAAAVERQKHFASVAKHGGADPGIFSGISIRGAGPRPVGILVVAILSFIEAAIWILPMVDDFSHGRAKMEDAGALLLVCAGAATGFGLLKLMGWARLLKVVVAAVDVILMLITAQNAFHEGGGGTASWIGIFIFMIWSAWYMFTPRVKQAFSKAA